MDPRTQSTRQRNVQKGTRGASRSTGEKGFANAAFIYNARVFVCAVVIIGTMIALGGETLLYVALGGGLLCLVADMALGSDEATFLLVWMTALASMIAASVRLVPLASSGLGSLLLCLNAVVSIGAIALWVNLQLPMLTVENVDVAPSLEASLFAFLVPSTVFAAVTIVPSEFAAVTCAVSFVGSTILLASPLRSSFFSFPTARSSLSGEDRQGAREQVLRDGSVSSLDSCVLFSSATHRAVGILPPSMTATFVASSIVAPVAIYVALYHREVFLSALSLVDVAALTVASLMCYVASHSSWNTLFFFGDHVSDTIRRRSLAILFALGALLCACIAVRVVVVDAAVLRVTGWFAGVLVFVVCFGVLAAALSWWQLGGLSGVVEVAGERNVAAASVAIVVSGAILMGASMPMLAPAAALALALARAPPPPASLPGRPAPGSALPKSTALVAAGASFVLVHDCASRWFGFLDASVSGIPAYVVALGISAVAAAAAALVTAANALQRDQFAAAAHATATNASQRDRSAGSPLARGVGALLVAYVLLVAVAETALYLEHEVIYPAYLVLASSSLGIGLVISARKLAAAHRWIVGCICVSKLVVFAAVSMWDFVVALALALCSTFTLYRHSLVAEGSHRTVISPQEAVMLVNGLIYSSLYAKDTVLPEIYEAVLDVRPSPYRVWSLFVVLCAISALPVTAGLRHHARASSLARRINSFALIAATLCVMMQPTLSSVALAIFLVVALSGALGLVNVARVRLVYALTAGVSLGAFVASFTVEEAAELSLEILSGPLGFLLGIITVSSILTALYCVFTLAPSQWTHQWVHWAVILLELVAAVALLASGSVLAGYSSALVALFAGLNLSCAAACRFRRVTNTQEDLVALAGNVACVLGFSLAVGSIVGVGSASLGVLSGADGLLQAVVLSPLLLFLSSDGILFHRLEGLRRYGVVVAVSSLLLYFASMLAMMARMPIALEVLGIKNATIGLADSAHHVDGGWGKWLILEGALAIAALGIHVKASKYLLAGRGVTSAQVYLFGPLSLLTVSLTALPSLRIIGALGCLYCVFLLYIIRDRRTKYQKKI